MQLFLFKRYQKFIIILALSPLYPSGHFDLKQNKIDKTQSKTPKESSNRRYDSGAGTTVHMRSYWCCFDQKQNKITKTESKAPKQGSN